MQDNPDKEMIGLADQVRFRAVGDEGVLVHLESGNVMVVSDVGLYILQQLNQRRTRTDLAAAIVSEFEVSTAQAETDLDVFLVELDKEQVLVRLKESQ